MKLRTATFLGLAIAALALAVSAAFWNSLPPQVATHFAADGAPNGWQPRAIASLIMPCAIVLIALLFAAMPMLSPQGYGVRRFEPTVSLFALATESVLLFMHVSMLWAARMNRPFSISAMMLVLSLLFTVMGARFADVRRNFFIGIRTPWTLADEQVWSRTHQLAGRLLVIAGLIGILFAFAPPAMIGAWVVLLGAALVVPAVYSFFIYRGLHPERAE